jgi:hypothetical protein
MKLILLVGIFFWCFANILAEQKTITCKVETIQGQPGCRFSGVKIGPNEAFSIKTDPEDADVNSIIVVEFKSSSIHSIPLKIFVKFPRVERFYASEQNIQEIQPDTFLNADRLEVINLEGNALTFLHPKTFKGEILIN